MIARYDLINMSQASYLKIKLVEQCTGTSIRAMFVCVFSRDWACVCEYVTSVNDSTPTTPMGQETIQTETPLFNEKLK